MKGIVLFAACLAPTLAFGQQTYTNADLTKFQVPGAYTNEDLKRLAPLPMQKAPAVAMPRVEPSRTESAGYQALYDSLRRARTALAAEIDYEKQRVDRSESAFAGDTRDYGDRLGYRTMTAPLIRELTARVALLDGQMNDLADEARRAGADLDRR